MKLGATLLKNPWTVFYHPTKILSLAVYQIIRYTWVWWYRPAAHLRGLKFAEMDIFLVSLARSTTRGLGWRTAISLVLVPPHCKWILSTLVKSSACLLLRRDSRTRCSDRRIHKDRFCTGKRVESSYSISPPSLNESCLGASMLTGDFCVSFANYVNHVVNQDATVRYQ